MNGVTVDDLVNLTNTGELTANPETSVFVTGQADESELSRYQWQIFQQNRQESPRLLVTLAQHPGVALGANQQLFYSTTDAQHNTTSIHKLELSTAASEQSWQLSDHQLTLQEELSTGQLLLTGHHHLQASADDRPWHPVTEVPYWSNDEGLMNETRHHLWLFDPQTEQLTDLLPADFDLGHYWSQDEHLYLTGVAYQGVRPFKDGLYKYDFEHHQLVELLKPARYRIDAVARLKDQLYVVASNGYHYGMGEHPNFYRYQDGDLDLVLQWDANVGNIVVDDVTVVGGNSTAVHDQKLYFYSTIVDHNELYEFDGQEVRKVFSWPGALNSFAFRNQELLFTATCAEEPQQLYQYHAGEFKPLSHFNSFLHHRQVSKMHPVDYRDSTGMAAHGWVLPPVNYQVGKKYPAILEVHGGPRATYGYSFFHEMQVLANAGYFVFFTNIHGSEGQGDDYADLRGKYGEVDFVDLMSFTDAVLAEFEDIDEQHLGVTGGSYGGFMTNWVVGHTDRFHAAVSERSIATWSSMLISDIGPEFVTDQMATDLAANDGMEKFWVHSPLRYVKNIHTPILFLHSDHDFRCPIPEGYQMFQAVKLQGVSTRMVVFHGSNHDLSRTGRPDQRMQRLTEVLSWFDKFLK